MNDKLSDDYLKGWVDGKKEERARMINKLRYHLPKFTILHGSKDLKVKDFLKECGLDELNEKVSK